MKRLWVHREELEAIKDLFRRELRDGINTVYIPFERIIPLLRKPIITRILWCRSARSEWSRIGLKVGIRNSRNAYFVQVIDPVRWHREISGVQHGNEQPHLHDDTDHDDLIPEPDPDYVMPDFAYHLCKSIDCGEKILLVGPTGSGKSSLIREICAINRKRFMRMNLNGETSVDQIIGGWRIRGKEMVFQYGPVPEAMRIGAWLCLDEFDAAIPQVLFALQAVLEDRGRLYIPEVNEWVEPHPEFRLIATANTIGRGDDSGMYSGTSVLNEASLDRFHAVFSVDYLPVEMETALLMKKVESLRKSDAERMVRVANDLRKALRDGVIYSTFSTRKLIAWGKKLVQIGSIMEASQYTILNKVSEDDRRVIREVLQRHGF